jgi:ABC-type Fe3+ transport system substrate-binding protein
MKKVATLMLVSTKPGKSDRSAQPPSHLSDLLRPEYKNLIALARPTAGTTGGHVAALYELRGQERARRFFRALHDNGVVLVGGNAMVAESVARGDLRIGVCDNDDAADAEPGRLDAVLPDQGDGEDGTLAMPCAVGMVTACPHPDAARRLIDYLLSHEADQRMAKIHFAWCSARSATGKGSWTWTIARWPREWQRPSAMPRR